MSVVPFSACAVAVAVLLVAESRDSAIGRWIAKPIASTAFVWAGIAAGGMHSGYGQLVLLGLALCWCGDVLLIPTARASWFRAGIAAFLLGHVAYIVAFLTRPLDIRAFVVAACVMLAFGWGVLRWLSPHLTPDFRVPVRAYVATICTMAVTALAMTAGGGPLGVAAGALAFVASDLSVARDRFVSRTFANRLWGLPLYYVAQVLLATTIAQVT